MKIIDLNRVNFKYHITYVLKDVTFSVDKNDFIGLIGPNGGGKSTLLKLLLGILTPNSGEIKIFAKDVKQNIDLIGYVPQNTDFNRDFPISVIDVVLMGRLKKNNFGKYSDKDIEIANNSLKKVKMYDFKERAIGTLSGGQRQRVFIARALATEPKIILLDEPTASIDSKGQKEIFEILKELNLDMTIIVVTHDINSIIEYAKTIIYVDRTIYIHNSPKLSIANLKDKLNITDGHLCPIELINYGVCK